MITFMSKTDRENHKKMLYEYIQGNMESMFVGVVDAGTKNTEPILSL